MSSSFRLNEEPFRLTPDPRYFLPVAEARRSVGASSAGLDRVERLRLHHRRRRNRQDDAVAPSWRSSVERERRVYLRTAARQSELLRRLCVEFDIVPKSSLPERLLDALQRHLVAQHAAGRICVVVFDGRRRSIELLEQVRLLLNFETPTGSCFASCRGAAAARKLLLNPDPPS
jgi:type II secretory pathway predicted ATPase ExeA